MTTSPRWIARTHRAPDSVRLLCFPQAGASGSSTFRRWGREFPAFIDVCPVDLPGRWGRLQEEPLRRLSALIEALEIGLEGELEQPFALFGYSMGALLAFELARSLRDRRGIEPIYLFTAAFSTRPFNVDLRLVHDPLDDSFLDMVARTIGIANAAALPPTFTGAVGALRADYELLGSYRYSAGPPLTCPITAYAGSDDPVAPPGIIEDWATCTTGPFSSRTFASGHFFIHDFEDDIMRDVVAKLASVHRCGECDAAAV